MALVSRAGWSIVDRCPARSATTTVASGTRGNVVVDRNIVMEPWRIREHRRGHDGVLASRLTGAR